MRDDIIIQEPAETAAAPQLLLLFHGVGADAASMRPLGEALSALRPHAFVVSVRSPDASDLGQGWQWFPVRGVTEADRPARVAAAMPRFAETVRAWQRESGVGAGHTALIGFSQGAIMALESTQLPQPVAGLVIAIAGRFAQPPSAAPRDVRLHLLHGEQDRVMPPVLATDAASQWTAIGGSATLDLFPGLGHGIDARVVRRVAEHLAAPRP